MSESSHSRGERRCVFFATNGVSLIKLPLAANETLTLIDSAGGTLRFLRFSPADCEQITAALDAGAIFHFAEGLLHLEIPRLCLELTPLAPDDASAKPPALPSPRDIQRLHEEPPAASASQ